MAELRQRFPISMRGLNVRQLSDLCAANRLTVRALRCEIEELKAIAKPSILHWGLNHFVILLGVLRNGDLRVVDPAVGERVVSSDEASRKFTGVALEVSPALGFQRRKVKSPLSLWSLLPIKGDVVKLLAHGLVLSIVLQAYVVASPFLVQLAVDEAAIKGDLGLLTVLALGFGCFAVLNAVAEAFRSVVLQRASSLIGWGMTTSLFHHMLRLPLGWFQRRRLADTLARFDSLDPIRSFVANGVVAVTLDGVLATSVLVMMFFYSPLLAAVVLATTAVLAAVKAFSISPSMRYAMDALQCQIAEKGKRIETLRAIQTIKLLGGEAARERDWAGKLGDTIAAQEQASVLSAVIRSCQTLFESVGLVVVVYFGARGVFEGSMSIGMLYAFLSYRQQFSSRSLALVDQMIAWKMLDMHSDRIADIALHQMEEGAESAFAIENSFSGSISLSRVFFRYSPQEPEILRDVSLSVRSGDFIALTGSSGEGKSTLLKVMIGLYPAGAGEIRYDASPLSPATRISVRASLGTVMQDDELLSGSIGENVSFFDESPNVEWIWECLRLAALDDEVSKMPMQLHTLIGDMGSSLSGGQRQRLLLARAMYRKPKILFLDEATSNLDIERERLIHDNLRRLSITRVLITHRPETMRLADKIFLLRDGGLHQVDASQLVGVSA